MKKVVISLKRTPERLEGFKQNHPGMFVDVIEGIDGKLINPQQVPFKTSPAWRGPYNNRRILKGEVGCFLSHFTIWAQVANDTEPVWIMEDDSITPNWEKVEADIEGLGLPYDILYVGYNENEITPDGDSGFIPTETVMLKKMNRPYNLHSYVLTPQGALRIMKYLADNPYMMPSDDLLCEIIQVRAITAYGLARPASKQIPRTQVPSTIEPTSEDDYYLDFSVHVLTYGTDQSKMNALFDSASVYSIYPKNIGKGMTWNGGDMTTVGGMQKLKGLSKYIQNLPDHDVVLFTDAYDVFYADDLETIVKRFLSFDSNIVFGAEKNCWPDLYLADQYPVSPTSYRYLNSGCFIGDVSTLKQILALPEFNDNDDDQRYLTQVFLENQDKSVKREYRLKLDYEGYIFVVDAEKARVAGQYKQLNNPETRTMGCIYHGAGGEAAKNRFDNLYAQFKPPVRLNYIPGSKKVDVIDRDMLIVDFFTKSQCDAIIEIAEKHGGWAPKPGDSYPAQEIRLKLLQNDIYELIDLRWNEYVKPIIEQYFTPLKTHGLRDAFVMKYTLDTQKRLDLHNDASLVTGSIKLNDDYTGANLVYPRQGISNANIPVGKMLLFPGQVTHPHECNDLISGTKYSMTLWSKRHPGDT